MIFSNGLLVHSLVEGDVVYILFAHAHNLLNDHAIFPNASIDLRIWISTSKRQRA
jgi:hypothetical protein